MNNRHNEIEYGVCEVLKRYLSPRRIIIFGSRAKGEALSHSDFDFAVDCARPSIDVERRLKHKIEKLSGLYRVDIIYLASVEEKFKEIVLKTGKVIYERRA